MKRKTAFCLLITCLLFVLRSNATTFYVSTSGSDTAGDGSEAKPWRTLRHAVSAVPGNAGHTIQLSEGTFVEIGPVEIPAGVNITGAAKNLTVLKAASSFYYNPAAPGYATDKFLISLKASNAITGNQRLKNFTIDGDSKKLHGGIYVRYRSGVTIENVKVQNTNFTGIWLWDVKDSKILQTDLTNCSWGSTGYCSGALNLGNVEKVEIDQLNVNESVGYGIKAIGPNGYNDIFQLKIHDSRVSVHPYGLWNNGSAPNIAIELWQVNLVGCEIFNSYVDNTISLVNSNANPSTGVQTIRVHHNTIDLDTRAKGEGYGVELTIHDAEIDHNYFLKGRYGIANWDNPMKNWEIHHNTFYALAGVYPGDIVRSQWSGIHNLNFYNNTIEFSGDKTMNVIGAYGGTSENIKLINNLFINNNTSYSYYPNALVHLENGAVMNTLTVKNNFFDRLAVGNVAGTYASNLTGDPKIAKTGTRPEAYYTPLAGSPLIDKGLNVLLSFLGLSPDIGAIEYNSGLINLAPNVNLTSPANNSTYTTGSSVTIQADASDADGNITKVEFFQGTVKLGEDYNSPYSYEWNNPAAGTYSIYARATDNKGKTTESVAAAITVANEEFVHVGLYAPDATLTGAMKLTNDATAIKGTYFSVPVGNGTNFSIPSPTNAEFHFSLPKTDTYVVWVRILSPSTNNQGYHVYDGKGNWTSWLAGVHTQWTWVRVTNAYTKLVASFPFTEGSNVFRMAWFHENVKVDAIMITNDPAYIPQETASEATQNSAVNVALFAADASMAGNMKLVSDANALNGSYFSMPSGSGKNYYIPPSSSAQFNFEVTVQDDYVIWAHIKSPSVNNQGFHVYDGKGNWTTWITGVYSDWTWVKITDAYSNKVATFPFSTGPNIFRMAWFHENTSVAGILITNDHSFTPIDKNSSGSGRMAALSEAQDDRTEGGSNIEVFPNPARDNFTITYSSPDEQPAKVVMKSATSPVETQMAVPLSKGQNQINVSTQGLPKGMYVLFVTSRAGRVTARKIMITE